MSRAQSENRYHYPGTEKTWDGEGISPDVSVNLPDEKRKILDAFLESAVLDVEKQLEIDTALAQAVSILREGKK